MESLIDAIQVGGKFSLILEIGRTHRESLTVVHGATLWLRKTGIKLRSGRIGLELSTGAVFARKKAILNFAR